MASFGDFQTAAADLPERVKALGFTSVEFRPSDRGSNSLFAPDWRYGTPEELRALTAAFHEKGLEVIFRWDPSRFDRSASGLQQFGLAPTYESADPLRSDTPDGKALYFDLGNKRVSNYLLCAALYYVEQLHADGLFFDDLSPMLYLDYDRQESGYTPNLYGGVENLDAVEFLKHLHSILQKRDAGAVSIAQLSSAWTSVTGRVEDDTLGFTFLMHGGWLQAHRQYLSCDPLFRRGAHNLLLEDLLYQYMENYILPLPDSAAGPGMSALLGGFHGDEKARLSALRLFLSLMMVHPGAKLMNLGETHRSLAGGEGRGELAPVDRMVKDLHALYRAQPALHQNDTRPDSFEWIRQMANDHCVLCALRRGSRPAEFLIIAVNGSGSDWQEEIGVPYAGGYQEIFNSEAKAYGGGAAVPRAARRASEKETDGRAYTVQLSLPASSVTIYQYV